MDSFISRAYDAARAKSNSLLTRGGLGVGGGGASPFAGLSNGSLGGGGPAGPSLNHHAEQYRHYNGWVFSSIRPIAQTVARQPLRVARAKKKSALTLPKSTAKDYVYTSKGPIRRDRAAQHMYFLKHLPGSMKDYAETAELLDWHPMLEALQNPNPIMVRWALFFVTVASIELTGKAYWWVRREETPDGKGKIEVWPVPSHWIQPIHTEQKLFSSWSIRPEGQTKPITVPLDQIVYFYTPDPSNPFSAYATLQAQARAVVADESISEAQRQSFARGIFPGYAVVMGRLPDAEGIPGQGERPTLTLEQRMQLSVAFKQLYRGVYNYDEPVILDQLVQDIKRITNTNREMDYLSSGEITKAKITQAFGVNPIVMGQVEGANRASAAAAQDNFYDLACNPKIILMSECMTAWFSALFAAPDERLLLFIEEAHATDPESDRLDWELLAREKAVSRNELRAGLRGLPPINGGDQIMVEQGVTFMPYDDVTDTVLPTPNLFGGGAVGVTDPAPTPSNPTTDPAPRPTAPTLANTTGTDVADTALNGAQISSLLLVIDKLASGEYPRETVLAILQSSFPQMPVEQIETILSGFKDKPHLQPPVPVNPDLQAKPPNNGQAGFELDKIRDGIVEAVTKQLATMPIWKRVEEVPTDFQALTLNVPKVAQSTAYDCGAAAARCVAEHYGMVHQWTDADFIAALDTNDATGTAPRHMVDLFKHNGCEVQYGPHWSLGRLFNALKQGHPVICCIQGMTFGDDVDRERQQNGHWVVVDGMNKEFIVYMDPLTGQSEQATWKEWNENWRDRGQDGTSYDRWAIAIGPPPPAFIDPQTNTGNTRFYTSQIKVKGYYCYAKSLTWQQRIDALKKSFTRQENTLKIALLTHFSKERERLALLVHEWAKHTNFIDVVPLEEELEESLPYDEKAAHSKDRMAEQLLESLLPLEATTAKLVQAVQPALEQVLLDTAGDEWHDLQPRDHEKAKKPKPDRTPLPKPIRQTCHEYLGRVVSDPYWEDMTYRTRLQMARAIRRGVAHGDDRDKIAKRILDVVSEKNDATRAQLIARTEANGAVNLGQHAVRTHLISQGAELTKRWAAIHSNTRASHEKADGQEVKNSNKFRVGGEWCLYPGDQNLSPKERCNCQCSALSVPKGVDPQNPTHVAINVPDYVNEEDANRVVHRLFSGDSLASKYNHLAQAVGMPDDAKITLSAVSEYNPKEPSVELFITHPDLSGAAVRVVGIDADGKTYIKNQFLEVVDKGKGKGAEIFGKQVALAQKHGVSYIETYAAGEKGSTMNGYYSWPRMGYDMSLTDPSVKGDKAYRKARKEFPDAKTVLDIFQTKRGRDWWKEHGSSMPNARFDLTPGSRSLKVLRAYQTAKAKQRGGKSAEAAPPTPTEQREECDLSPADELALDAAWNDLTGGA